MSPSELQRRTGLAAHMESTDYDEIAYNSFPSSDDEGSSQGSVDDSDDEEFIQGSSADHNHQSTTFLGYIDLT